MRPRTTYAFSYGTTQFNDYPKLGVWPDAYYTTFNIFTNGRTRQLKLCATIARPCCLGRSDSNASTSTSLAACSRRISTELPACQRRNT